MLKIWRYVVVAATIFAAILTPSTDPITQSFFTLAVLFLYFAGIFVLVILKK